MPATPYITQTIYSRIVLSWLKASVRRERSSGCFDRDGQELVIGLTLRRSEVS